ncbi:MAG: hypothetical protein IIC74_00745 [Bacteroidetes bacterium]|nr:hypothetical protein [Bacteroidota bacterium]
MTELPSTIDNIRIIQEFISETRKRISEGVDITFTRKASSELESLMLDYDINEENIEYAILNLTPENYYRGIDPSGGADFSVCAFRVLVGNDNVEIYLKYGLEVDGLQILIFSNHIPDYPMSQPFKN